MDYLKKEQQNSIMQDKIIFYFIIYSFLGWCLESIYKTIIFKKPTNSGFLYGPFCPMYGIGAILMIWAGQLSSNPIVIFIMAFLIFSVWEYLVAVIIEKLFKTKYWDYSDLKFNLQGRVCLKNSIYWGILGVLLIYVIQPVIRNLTEMIPDDILVYVDVILMIAILVDTVITIFRIMFIDKKIRQVFEIGETIKEKILELKNIDLKEKAHIDNLQRLISDLKEKQDILKIKIYKRIIRLKKSFPEMKSENLTKFMTQKISLDSLKNKMKERKNKKVEIVNNKSKKEENEKTQQ